jgi:hypothetical protein
VSDATSTSCLAYPGFLATNAFAQGTGQINGALTDTSGGVIPGATVSAIESATGIKTDTVTGANGRYSFPSIRPTTYEIRAELTGFKTVRRTDITLQANQNLTVNITLELGDLAETITVAGEAATVDISSATISEVVDHARIVELPIAGREVARLQTLVAGTVLASVSEETGKSIPGAVRISANGAGERQNSYRLDGANNTDPYFQENQSFPFPDALQEFSIQTSNYSASHGNNAGAVVNVVTRSGTNNFHGGAFEYLRDRTFNAKGFFAAEKDFLKRNQYGGFAAVRSERTARSSSPAGSVRASPTAHQSSSGSCPRPLSVRATSRTARRRARSSTTRRRGCHSPTTRFLPICGTRRGEGICSVANVHSAERPGHSSSSDRPGFEPDRG